jgi:hypothetical protein
MLITSPCSLKGHSFGPINEIMDVLQIAEKSGMLDTLEKFYIFRETTTRQPD